MKRIENAAQGDEGPSEAQGQGRPEEPVQVWDAACRALARIYATKLTMTGAAARGYDLRYRLKRPSSSPCSCVLDRPMAVGLLAAQNLHGNQKREHTGADDEHTQAAHEGETGGEGSEEAHLSGRPQAIEHRRRNFLSAEHSCCNDSISYPARQLVRPIAHGLRSNANCVSELLTSIEKIDRALFVHAINESILSDMVQAFFQVFLQVCFP